MLLSHNHLNSGLYIDVQNFDSYNNILSSKTYTDIIYYSMYG
jgi:hypothetical protein